MNTVYRMYQSAVDIAEDYGWDFKYIYEEAKKYGFVGKESSIASQLLFLEKIYSAE